MMDFQDYLNSLPEDEDHETWAIRAAASIGTLATQPGFEMDPRVKATMYILFKRMPTSLMHEAQAYAQERVDEAMDKDPEFQDAKAEVDLLIEAVEKGIDPDEQ